MPGDLLVPRSVPEMRVSRGLKRLSVYQPSEWHRDVISEFELGRDWRHRAQSGSIQMALLPTMRSRRKGRAGATPDFEFSRRIEGEMPFLRCPIRRWHGDKAEADDLVQDSLCRLSPTRSCGNPVWICTAGEVRRSRSPDRNRKLREARPILRDLACRCVDLPGGGLSDVEARG
jgi:hypothetical protein